MPTCYFNIIIGNIAAIPSKNNIAKTVTALQAVNKLLGADNLASQNAVDIGKGKLYFLDIIFFDICDNLFRIHCCSIKCQFKQDK
jgi:hypothetical protein